MALKCDNGFYQFLHTGRDIPQQDYLSRPSGTVWASRLTTLCSPEQGLVVDGAEVDGTMWGRRVGRNGHLSTPHLWVRGGEDSETFLSQAAGTAVAAAAAEPRMGLSVASPSGLADDLLPHCWLWAIGAGLSLRFEQAQREGVS